MDGAGIQGLTVGLREKVETLLSRLELPLAELGFSFELELPSGETIRAGREHPEAKIILRNAAAAKSLLSLREDRLADSYLSGDLDLEGSLPDILKTRQLLTASHGAAWLARFIVPALLGQVAVNRTAIRKHYDLDAAFYLSFLDSTWPAYSQGIYRDKADTLASTIERKFDIATKSCQIGPDTRVLEVGPAGARTCATCCRRDHRSRRSPTRRVSGHISRQSFCRPRSH
jgi:hypothetical protein